MLLWRAHLLLLLQLRSDEAEKRNYKRENPFGPFHSGYELYSKVTYRWIEWSISDEPIRYQQILSSNFLL